MIFISIGAVLIAIGAVIIALKKKNDPRIEENEKNIREVRKLALNNKKHIEEVDATTPKAIEKTNGEVWLIYNDKTIYKTEVKKKK